jgi:hypothetical protein
MSTHSQATRRNWANEGAALVALATIVLGAILISFQWESQGWQAVGISLLAAAHAMLARGPR